MAPAETRAARREIAKAAMTHENPEVVALLERANAPGILFEFAGSSEMPNHCENLVCRLTSNEELQKVATAHMVKHCRIIEAMDV